MNVDTFFEKFEVLASAANAIAAMRSLVLRLAMQGKLCEPHPSDGETSALLNRVNVERGQFGLESISTALNGTSAPEENLAANVIPARWMRVRFGDIARHNAGRTLDKGRNRGQLREYITTSNLYWGFFQLDSLRKMPIEDEELERCTAIKGDLLIVEGGEAGRAAVWDQDWEIAFQNHIHRARFFAGINPYFVQRYFEKLNASGEIEKYRKGVGISNMSGKSLASIPIPLPPLAEQKRIVAKVDELMALCDRLEAQQRQREHAHAALTHAALARFADAATAENLEYLFNTSSPTPPSDLRASILANVVRGDFAVDRSTTAAKLGEVIVLVSGRHLQPDSWNQRGEGIPYLTGPADFGPKHPVATRWTTAPEAVAEAGDILVTVKGAGVGKTNVLDVGPVAISRQLMAVRVTGADPEFIHLVLQHAATHFQSVMTGIAIPGIGRSDLLDLEVALPSLAEQRRIVATVHDLMALVDRLEADIAAARVTGEKLMDAIVAEITTPNALGDRPRELS